MTTISTREEAEKALVRSLSRHIGYTSGAYDLGRIFSTLDMFSDHTSVYREELIAFLGDFSPQDGDDPLSPEYRSDILSFALSMGLLETISSREAGLTRYAATELGRSVLGAKAVGSKEFYDFYSAQIVLRADADFLVSILAYYEGEQAEDLHSFFLRFQATLRQRRLAWLLKNFSEPVLLTRIAAHLSWLSKKKGPLVGYEIDIPTMNTARHHATPRVGWIEKLGMFDRDKKALTSFGRDVLLSLKPQGGFFWLAPHGDVLDALKIADRPDGATEGSLVLTSGQAEATTQELSVLIDDLYAVMVSGYKKAKLIHASQASLQLAVEYIQYRSYVDKRTYPWDHALELLFQEKRGSVERYSARKGKIGFYRILG